MEKFSNSFVCLSCVGQPVFGVRFLMSSKYKLRCFCVLVWYRYLFKVLFSVCWEEECVW